MSDTGNKLAAEARTDHGKGHARRLRREGKLPAVIYSKGNEATSVVVSPKEFVKVVTGPLRRNTLIELDIAGAKRNVMVRDIQIDPIRRNPLHVDFWEVDPATPVVLRVPFRTTGRSKAVVAGAKLNLVMRDLRVRVAPNAVPEKITVDVTDLPQGPFRAKEVQSPPGCELMEDGHLTVLTISRPRGELAEGAGADGAAPDGDAPAAG